MVLRWLLWLIHLPLQVFLLTLFLAAEGLWWLSLPLRVLLRRPSPPPAVESRLCTIVILNWNGRHLLEESLPALRRALRREADKHQVLIVDNGSQDDSVDWVRKNFPDCDVLALPENLGFAEGNNRGVSEARHSIVVLLNNDMIVEEGFLGPLLESFEDPDLFAATCQIFLPKGKRREETGNTRSRWRAGYLELSHEPVGEAHLRRKRLAVLWGGGGSTAFHRERFQALGGFSHLYSPVYVEDADLSYRAWRRGWKVLLVAESRVLHKHRSSSSSRFSPEEIRDLNEERRLWYVWRNFPFPSLVGHLLAFPIHLREAISPSAYWRALRKLPQVLALRFLEPPRRYSHREVASWIGKPLSYLERFHPNRAQLSRKAERLRILIVSAYLPHLGYHGGAGRVFQLLRQVSQRHDVTLATFVETEKEMREVGQVRPFCRRVEVVKRGHFEPVSFYPYEPFEEFNCPRFRRLLEEMLIEEDFDLVHFEWASMVQYADLFPRIGKLLTEIEVLYASHHTQVRVLSNPWRKFRKFYETLQTFRRELQMGNRVDRVICVTDEDRDYLRGYLPSERLRVVNTGVEPSFYTPGDPSLIEPCSIVFVGAFRHAPNIDAMRFFCREVFPRIQQGEPRTHLYIVGSSPPPSIRALGGQGSVTVTGFVEDLLKYYRLAQVVVVPLRTGVGIRGKVLEGWSAGKAMVATSLACQGIQAIHGENILIADDPREFADWTLALLRHPEYAEALGASGRRLVESRYDWTSLGRRMCQVYEELVEDSMAGHPSRFSAGGRREERSHSAGAPREAGVC